MLRCLASMSRCNSAYDLLVMIRMPIPTSNERVTNTWSTNQAPFSPSDPQQDYFEQPTILASPFQQLTSNSPPQLGYGGAAILLKPPDFLDAVVLSSVVGARSTATFTNGKMRFPRFPQKARNLTRQPRPKTVGPSYIERTSKS